MCLCFKSKSHCRSKSLDDRHTCAGAFVMRCGKFCSDASSSGYGGNRIRNPESQIISVACTTLGLSFASPPRTPHILRTVRAKSRSEPQWWLLGTGTVPRSSHLAKSVLRASLFSTPIVNLLSYRENSKLVGMTNWLGYVAIVSPQNTKPISPGPSQIPSAPCYTSFRNPVECVMICTPGVSDDSKNTTTSFA